MKKRSLCAVLTLLLFLTALAPSAMAAPPEPVDPSLPLTPTGETEYVNVSELVPGFTFTDTVLTNADGKRVETYSLETSAGGPVYPIVTAGDVIHENLDLTEAIARAEAAGLNVLGGINADFFYGATTWPLGAVVADGRYITDPGDENVLAFDENGAFFSARPQILIMLENLGGGEYTDELGVLHSNAGKLLGAHHLNKTRVAHGGIYLYDSAYDREHTDTDQPGWGVRFKILEGTLTVSGEMTLQVEEVIPEGTDFAIGEGTVVMTSQAADLYGDGWTNFSVGDLVTLRTSCSDERLAGARWATGCGDLLAENGMLTDPAGWDQALTALHPRTALGIKPDGSVIACAVDGRRSSYSNGALLENIASDLIERGCTSVVNLDGGGSTVMAARLPGQETCAVVNRPSTVPLRKCSTYILFVSDALRDGVPASLHLSEDGAQILTGARMPLELLASDGAGYPAELPEDAQAVPLLGSVSEGVYTAGEPGEDTLTLVSPSANAVGYGTLHVLDAVDTLTVTDAATEQAPVLTNLPEGASVRLALAAASHGKSVTVTPSAAEFDLDPDLGTVTDGVLTVSARAKYEGELTVAAGGRTVVLPVSVERPEGFPDTQDHWARDSIDFLRAQGAVNGNEQGLYEPDAAMTRAAFVTMIWNILDKPEALGACTYADVPEDAWCYAPVAWSQSVALTQGGGDGLFDPEGALTREQGFTILYRLLHDLLRRELPDPAPEALASFADAGDTSAYALDAAQTLVSAGLVQGNGGLLSPKVEMTRAEMAVLMVRVFY